MEISWIYSRVNVPGFVPKKRSNLEKFSFITFQNSEQKHIQFFFTRNYSLQKSYNVICVIMLSMLIMSAASHILNDPSYTFIKIITMLYHHSWPNSLSKPYLFGAFLYIHISFHSPIHFTSEKKNRLIPSKKFLMLQTKPLKSIHL